jgi:hypothetical protein
MENGGSGKKLILDIKIYVFRCFHPELMRKSKSHSHSCFRFSLEFYCFLRLHNNILNCQNLSFFSLGFYLTNQTRWVFLSSCSDSFSFSFVFIHIEKLKMLLY